MKTVSVHIVTYNSEKLIQKCLLCLSQQTYTDFSVHIVDNASSDKTVSICKSFPFVVVHHNKHNVGYAAAHNQALRLTKSTYVLTLNPDVFLKPDFLKTMVVALDQNPQAGSAAGLLLRTDGMDIKPFAIDGAGLFMRKNRRQGLCHEGEKIHPLAGGRIFGPDGAAAFYRRIMLEDIAIEKEIFDEDFFMHKEDVDVAWRAQRAGWISLFVPRAVAWHIRTFRSGQRKNVSPQLRLLGLRNRYLLLLKNDAVPFFLRDAPAIIFYDIGIFLYTIVFERSSFHAYREVIRLWSVIKRKRISIQARWPLYTKPYQYFI